MKKYPKLKNFWFPERIEKAVIKIKKHYGFNTQAETVRFLISEEARKLEEAKNAPQ